MKFFVCKNNHSFTNLKVCPSCFHKAKFYCCKQCHELIGVWEKHHCFNNIQFVIEVKKEKVVFKQKILDLKSEIKRIFGPDCIFYHLPYLEQYLVCSGQRYYNVFYFDDYIQKIERVEYNKISLEQWTSKDYDYYFEYEGSNLYDYLKRINHEMCYEVIRKLSMNSLFEFLIGYPVFEKIKLDLESKLQSKIRFVEYDNDFYSMIAKFYSLFVKNKKKKNKLLE